MTLARRSIAGSVSPGFQPEGEAGDEGIAGAHRVHRLDGERAASARPHRA